MGKKTIRLTESDLKKIIKKVISEQGSADINMDRVNRQQIAAAPVKAPATTSSSNNANDAIKTKTFPCFTTTSVPYDYNPKRDLILP